MCMVRASLAPVARSSESWVTPELHAPCTSHSPISKLAVSTSHNHTTVASLTRSSSPGRKWTDDEHARFVEALALYPRCSWKQRAAHVGTRTPRQVMSHAQKLALKAKRHARGLQKAGRPPHSRSRCETEIAQEHEANQLRDALETMDFTPADEVLMRLIDSLPLSSPTFDAILGIDYGLPLGSPKSPGSGVSTFNTAT